MARFRFHLIGGVQAPVVDVPVAGISELHQMLARSRYVEGILEEEGTYCGVLIPAGRIQLVVEADP
jgi:hypothetical protein